MSVLGRVTSRHNEKLNDKVQREFDADAAEAKAKAVRQNDKEPVGPEPQAEEKVHPIFIRQALASSASSIAPGLGASQKLGASGGLGLGASSGPGLGTSRGALQAQKTKRELLLEKKKAEASDVSVRSVLGLGSPLSPASGGGDGEDRSVAGMSMALRDADGTLALSAASSPSGLLKASISFTSMGKDGGSLSQTAMTSLGRWFHEKKDELRPELGRYAVQSSLTKPRGLKCDFKKRDPQLSKKVPAEDPPLWSSTSTLSEPDFLRSTQRSKDSTAQTSRSRPLSQMSLQSKRPDFRTVQGPDRSGCIKMTDLLTRPEDLEHHDKNTSLMPRRPVWDLSLPLPRGSVAQKTYYECGKFNIERSQTFIERGLKDAVKFHRQTGHAAPLQGHQSCPELLRHDQSTEATPSSLSVAQDRSLHRNGPSTRPRVVNVQDFGKDLDRPPIIKKKAAYHDERNPEVDSAVLRGEMCFDADAAVVAVRPRKDAAPNLGKSISRAKGEGNRMMADDCGMAGSKGLLFADTQVQLHSTVDQSKEEASRLRGDSGLRTFDTTLGREERSGIQSSPLKKPRYKAAPDFARRAACRGFVPSAGLGGPVKKWTRAHDAAPADWGIEALDDTPPIPLVDM